MQFCTTADLDQPFGQRVSSLKRDSCKDAGARSRDFRCGVGERTLMRSARSAIRKSPLADREEHGARGVCIPCGPAAQTPRGRRAPDLADSPRGRCSRSAARAMIELDARTLRQSWPPSATTNRGDKDQRASGRRRQRPPRRGLPDGRRGNVHSRKTSTRRPTRQPPCNPRPHVQL